MAEFYRRRLRRFALIRGPKEALWKARWFLRWRVVRPLARALLPAGALRHYHVLSGWGLRGFVRLLTTSPLPLLPHSRMAAVRGQFATEELFAPARVSCPPLQVFPVTLRGCVPPLEDAYYFPAVVLSRLPEVEVIAGSNLLVAHGAFVHHDLYRFSHDFTSEELHGRLRIDARRHLVKQTALTSPGPRLEHAAAFTDSCAPNYAHWLTEVLPRMHAYATGQVQQPRVALIDKGLHANLRESAVLVLGSDTGLEELAPGAAAHVADLQVVSPAGYIPFDRRPGAGEGHSHGIFSAPALLSMRAAIGQKLGSPTTAPPPRILLRRNAAARIMRNEQELADRLAPHGFVSVYPERLTFAEQYHLFSRAEVVIGATGAALANLVFCPSRTRIIICISAHPEHSFGYWRNMAAAVGNSVTYALGPVHGPAAAGIHADFSADIDAVLEAVQACDASGALTSGEKCS